MALDNIVLKEMDKIEVWKTLLYVTPDYSYYIEKSKNMEMYKEKEYNVVIVDEYIDTSII